MGHNEDRNVATDDLARQCVISWIVDIGEEVIVDVKF